MKTPPCLKNSRCLLWSSALGLACAATLSLSQAAEETLLPVQDAFIRSASAAEDNFNTPRLELAGRTGDANRKVYIQYELPQTAAQTTEAKLVLTATSIIANSGDSSGGFFPFKVFAAVSEDPDIWNETSINWNNAPGNTGGLSEVDAPWVEVGSMEVQLPLASDEQTVEVNLPDLPALLKKETGRNLTLVLVPVLESRTAPGLMFRSIQDKAKSAQWPTLILTQ